MRLTCPNCGAQYEVPDDVIPAEGRDVQCSNCGDTWFQAHADALLPEEAPTEIRQSTADEATESPSADAIDEQQTEAFDEVEPPEVTFDKDSADIPDLDGDEADFGGEDWDLEDEWQDGEADDQVTRAPAEDLSDTSEAAQDSVQSALEETAAIEEDLNNDAEAEKTPAPVTPRRRELDPAVADVLRQEAEHEATVRANEEHETLETQTELGLGAPTSDASKRESEARSRMRRLRGLTSEADPAAEPVQTDIHESRESRRDLLPDIEETNSTLRHTGDTARPAAAVDPAAGGASRARGFRYGFVLVFLAAALAVYVYSAHDNLGQSYPQFAPQIEGFVAKVDSMRVALDNRVTNLFLWMTEAASSGNAEQ